MIQHLVVSIVALCSNLGILLIVVHEYDFILDSEEYIFSIKYYQMTAEICRSKLKVASDFNQMPLKRGILRTYSQ
jgi:hypothetical protein